MSFNPRSIPLRFLHSTSTSRISTTTNGSRCFATSQTLHYPRSKTPRNNKRRGMSAIRSTGIPPWIKLSVSAADLKTPRKIQPAYEIDENHGLWGFFNQSRTILTSPDKMHEYGRAWAVQELRMKSFEELHVLWWQCLKEQNRIATENITRKLLKAGYGRGEADARSQELKKTMNGIRFVLTERYYAWENARKFAQTDLEVSVDEIESSVDYEPSIETMERRIRERSLSDIDKSLEDEELDNEQRLQRQLIPASVMRRPKSRRGGTSRQDSKRLNGEQFVGGSRSSTISLNL